MALTLSTAFFILSNLSVAPFYLLMIFAPRANLTRRVLGSLWPIALPAGVYVVFVAVIVLFLQPDVIGLWRTLYIENGLFSSATITFLSEIYGAFPEFAILHGWVHLVVGDMFMARWAYCDALELGIVPWIVALVSVLIAFIGPIGLILYLLLRLRYSQDKLNQVTAAG
jgi:hypothetical protein